MNDSTIEVFFYGLFMDESILLKKGIKPQSQRMASLEDYGLRIGERATLVPSAGETSYGIVMRVTESDLSKLYSDKTVSDYVPETVNLITDENETVKATCYILPAISMKGSNPSYAMSLLKLVRSLNFPAHYINHIEKMLYPVR